MPTVYPHQASLVWDKEPELAGPRLSGRRRIRVTTLIGPSWQGTDAARRLKRPQPGDRNSPGGT